MHSVHINLSRGALMRFIKLVNIEKTICPMRSRDILLFGKRTAWVDYLDKYLQ